MAKISFSPLQNFLINPLAYLWGPLHFFRRPGAGRGPELFYATENFLDSGLRRNDVWECGHFQLRVDPRRTAMPVVAVFFQISLLLPEAVMAVAEALPAGFPP